MTRDENKAMSLYYLICGYKENPKPENADRVKALEKELEEVLGKLEKAR